MTAFPCLVHARELRSVLSQLCHVGPNYERVINVWYFIDFFLDHKTDREEQHCLFFVIGQRSPSSRLATLTFNVFLTLDPFLTEECLLQVSPQDEKTIKLNM